MPDATERPAARLGAHMPTTGGLHYALQSGAQVGCELVQLFTTSPQQWRERAIGDEQLSRFRDAMNQSGIRAVSSHASYLINPAASDPEIMRKSREALAGEIRRCGLLGVPYAVTHLGARGECEETDALERLVESIALALRESEGSDVHLLIETTAGQGTCLGHRFEQLQQIVEGAGADPRLGICLDTCHIFAAGYDIRTPEGYAAVTGELDARIGLDRVRLIHANDSRRELGSRVDRHHHIGQGHIGLEGFRLLLNDSRLAHAPVVLETPKSGDMDPVNLGLLRSLSSPA